MLIAASLEESQSGVNTKAQLLDCYLRLAVHEGISAISLTRLGSELNISKQLVRYHLPDLEQVSLELFRISTKVGQDFTTAQLKDLKTFSELLPAWAEATFDWTITYSDFSKFMLLMYHRATVDQEARSIHVAMLQGGRNRVKEILKKSSNKKIQAHAVPLATTLHRLIVASFVEMISFDDIKNHQNYRLEFQNSMKEILKPYL